MAQIFDFDQSATTTIDEFCKEVGHINLDNENEIAALAPELNKLANNQAWMEDFILCGLTEPEIFQADNIYSAQSYMLKAINERAFLRFAIWAPKIFDDNLGEDNFYSYQTAHNHDFSLLTAGYLGEGYSTSLFEIPDHQNVTWSTKFRHPS